MLVIKKSFLFEEGNWLAEDILLTYDIQNKE